MNAADGSLVVDDPPAIIPGHDAGVVASATPINVKGADFEAVADAPIYDSPGPESAMVFRCDVC